VLTPEQIHEVAEILAGLAEQAADLGRRIDAVARRLNESDGSDDDQTDHRLCAPRCASPLR
jgi:hypothetical protein